MLHINDDTLKKSKILVVDDVELNRDMLVHSLKAAGYSNVSVAHDGERALEMTYEILPDMVVLDMLMPGIDGFAYCKEIRKDKQFDRMPIIVQTVLEQVENKIRAFRLGASDYICKPIDPQELAARVGVHLSNKLLTQSLIEYRQNMQVEFEAARKMQIRIMPSAQQTQMYERVFNMKIASYYETSSQLGGDCWGMRALSDTRLAVWMYDFSGHGITAAMNVFRLHTIVQEFIHASNDPGHFLSTLNRHLYALLDRGEFCTMFYGVIDTQANCLLYASAGAQPTLIVNSREAPVALLDPNFPLGSIKEAIYITQCTSFSPESLLLVYSDGLVETRNTENSCIDEDQLKNYMQSIVSDPGNNPAALVIENIVKLYRTFSGGAPPDDVTVGAFWRCEDA